jgi:N-acetylglutamate synthase-like GNAT family acetyltransferase
VRREPRRCRAIRRLIDEYSPDGNLLAKAPVTLFEDIQEFVVAEVDGQIVGCGALHVMWEDLAEVRTLAVAGRYLRQGIGSAVLHNSSTAPGRRCAPGVLPYLHGRLLRRAWFHRSR